ncbi:MAG: hypothetical protein HOQ37_23825, partial [Cupriavidus sp.]|nr:hypothetical protein [Cupriavidus sp.]
GTLTPADSAAAASKAVATAVASAPGTADLASGALIAGVVSSAVQNAQSGLPASLQANVGAVAANVAALAAPVIASEVASVNTALEAIEVSSSPAETLSALTEGGSINVVTQSAQTTTTTALVQAVTAAALTNAANAAGLAQLGDAVSGGSAAEIQQVAANLGGVVDAGAINSVADAVRLKNSLVLSNLTINGVTQPITDNITATGGALDAIQVGLAQNGDAFNGGPTQVRAGLRYTYNGNQVDVIIENVTLTFNGSQLVDAVVPANTAYSFRVSGNLSVAASLANAAADSLFSSANGGSLNLPFTTFLGKLRSSGALSQAQVDALTPKATSTFPVTFATTTGRPGRDVRVGMLVNNDVAFAKTALVKTDAEMVVGDGLKTTVTLNP